MADRLRRCQLEPHPYQQQCPSNIVECYKLNDSFVNVECCFDIVAVFGNNVAGFRVSATMSNEISSFRQIQNKMNMYSVVASVYMVFIYILL